jgi:hypothetical protein
MTAKGARSHYSAPNTAKSDAVKQSQMQSHYFIFEPSDNIVVSWMDACTDVEFSRAGCKIIFSAYVTSIVSSSTPMPSGEH